MPLQITIIGLGQIGTSIGLALAKHSTQVLRVGHDKEPAIAKEAQKKGAVDHIKHNLPSAVRGSDIILLCLPLNEIRGTLEVIAADLKEGAVIMDTAPVKKAIGTWIKELIPEGRSYVGLVPVINPDYLHETAVGIEAAHADLFHDGLMLITPLQGTPGGAVQLAADLSALLGAAFLFSDTAEADGLMASTHLLPQLVAAALLNITVDQPGWLEARKLAGRAYAAVTAPIVNQDEINALDEAALLNRENVVRVLDGMIASMQYLRDGIAAGDKGDLSARLAQAQEGRLRWWQERKTAAWLETNKPDISAVPGFWERMLGSRIAPTSKK